MKKDNLIALYNIVKESEKYIDEDTVYYMQTLTDDDITKIRNNAYPYCVYELLTYEGIRDLYSTEVCDKILEIVNDATCKEIADIIVYSAVILADKEWADDDLIDILRMIVDAKGKKQAKCASNISDTISNHITMDKLKEIVKLMTTQENPNVTYNISAFVSTIWNDNNMWELDSTMQIIRSIGSTNNERQSSNGMNLARNNIRKYAKIEDNQEREAKGQELAEIVTIVTAEKEAYKQKIINEVLRDKELLSRGIAFPIIKIVNTAYSGTQDAIYDAIMDSSVRKLANEDLIDAINIIGHSCNIISSVCAKSVITDEKENIIKLPADTIKKILTIISQCEKQYQAVAACNVALHCADIYEKNKSLNIDCDLDLVELTKAASHAIGIPQADNVYYLGVDDEVLNDGKRAVELIEIVGQAKTEYQSDYALCMAANTTLLCSNLAVKMAKIASQMKDNERICLTGKDLEDIIDAARYPGGIDRQDKENLYEIFDITDNFWELLAKDDVEAMALLDVQVEDPNQDISIDTKIKRRKI